MTKILAFSDLHCKTKFCNQIVEKSHEADILIGAGDFGNFRKGLDKTFEILNELNKPTLMVPGNHESLEELENICQGHPQFHILHGSGTRVNDIDFFGIGGGIPVTPFGSWSHDFTEEEAIEMLSNMPENCVLISHSPPKGTLDRNRIFMSLGSTSVRDTILSKKPILCVCGHIHESWGRTKMLGDTQVINAGPKGMLVEI